MNAAEEDQEQVQTENPSNLARGMTTKLIRAEVVLKRSCGIHNAEDHEHGAE